MKVIRYEKLVRDLIPEIISSSGKEAVIKTVKGIELVDYLNSKLSEELTEYLESGDVEELADLLEVVHAILSHKGISMGELEDMRREKRAARGGFERGIILLEVRE